MNMGEDQAHLIRPTLSVVMPNHNHARFLPESLGAILDQSHRPQEIIVIDDGSTDNSIEVIERLAQGATTLRLFRNDRNRGFIYSLNRGLEIASGEYVFGPAADDMALPGLFEKSMDLLTRWPQAGVCSTLSGLMNEEGEYKGLVHTPIISGVEGFLPPKKALKMLRRHGSWFMGNTVVYKRRALLEEFGYIRELGPYWDGFMDLVLALKHGACFIPEQLAVWRKMSGTYSATTSGRPDATLEINCTAERLMRTRYRDVFPPEYIEDWKRRLLCDRGAIFVLSSQQSMLASMRRLLRSPRWIDRVFLAGLRLGLAADYIVVKLYLFARFRRADLWWEFVRKLTHAAHPRIRRLAKDKRPMGMPTVR